MSPEMFHRLHELLTTQYGLTASPKSSCREALGIFLWICGAPQSVRQAKDRFERSLGTVHNLFYKVLKCLVALSADIINPRDADFTTMHLRLENTRFYPEFKRCIGAIDGTHIPMVVAEDMFQQHLCRKSKTTQNVMAACDFDMYFTFVLARWPGSVHDMRVFDDAMTRWASKFPMPPRGKNVAMSLLFSNLDIVNLQVLHAVGKYYLVDSGYANRHGFLSPYRQITYHIQDFQNAAEPPQGTKETFNYAHSSLRNVIERAFGVLKMK
jgi:hypothetical protein